MSTISGAAQAAGASVMHPYESSGELAAALNDFDVRTFTVVKRKVNLLTAVPVLKNVELQLG